MLGTQVRMVSVERPGVGESTNHRDHDIRDWGDDARIVVDHLGRDELAGGRRGARAHRRGVADVTRGTRR